jgi:S-adenosylhomocysteine hydrolase
MGESGTPGASLKAFAEFLPNSNIFGADVDREILFDENNIQTFYIDQTKYETYTEFSRSVNNIKFDLIIDDGLHLQSANLNTLYFALENLKKNGYLLIEDVPEFALETWKIIKNLLSNNFELKIIKTKIFYVVIVKHI